MKAFRGYLTPFLLFILTLLVYSLSHKGEGSHYNYFVYLAQAFSQGHLDIINPPSWLNEVLPFNNKYYVVYPPMPAILLVPAVWLLGMNTYQPALSILLSAANVALVYLVIKRFFKSSSIAIWTALLYSFGTMQWYQGEVGSAWYIAHIVGLFFLWLMLLEVSYKGRLWLIGLLIGLAYLARLPMILALVFIGLYYWSKFLTFRPKLALDWKNIGLLLVGLLPALGGNALYNYARFGTIDNIGYSLLPIFNEPWYAHGLFSYHYIWGHLKDLLWTFPKFQSTAPYIIPSVLVMAIWVVTPAFLLIPFARLKQPLLWAAFGTVLVMIWPVLLHGGAGFTQFGYRYTLDFHPFLILLFASALQKHFRSGIVLILLSILINLWGVIMISHLNLWTL